MPNALTGRSIRGLGQPLLLEDFHGLMGQLSGYRLDAQGLERRPHDFVTGLRFSAGLIYIVRKVLSEAPIKAHWGHVVGDDGGILSPERDVILHQPGYFQRWNGNKHPVMDFCFIRSSKVAAVISCKSFLLSIGADERQFCQDTKKSVDKVYLFAECCYTHRAAPLKANAQSAGYDGFWHLYTIDKKTGVHEQDPDVWLNFIDEMQRITCRPGRGE